VIAPRFEDARIMRVAHAYEQATDFHAQLSPYASAAE
jgi:Asp-tRNA(Asn)/Glu-tRNA(Gln) amidotransferase A subunit family amidase